jgi:hypothetical protein
MSNTTRIRIHVRLVRTALVLAGLTAFVAPAKAAACGWIGEY